MVIAKNQKENIRMNMILPRIDPTGRVKGRIKAANPMSGIVRVQNKLNRVVIPRSIGGIGARKVLNAGGINGGGLIKVAPINKVRTEAITEDKTKKVVPFVKVIEKPIQKEEWSPRMSETEKRMADFLEAAQEVKPLMDDVAEEQANATEPCDDSEFMKEQIEELPMGEGEKPPLDIPEERKEEEIVQKKRRGRKKGSRKVSEASKSE